MHNLVRQQIEQSIRYMNEDIRRVKEAASEAAQTLSMSDEKIKELVEVRASYQELLDA